MSLIIATAMLTWSVSGGTEPETLPNWSTAMAAPQGVSNTVRLDGNRLLWNGAETSEARVREFLGIVNQMNPQPLIVLSYDAQTPPARVRRARLLIEEAIRCNPSRCLEITASPARTARPKLVERRVKLSLFDLHAVSDT